MKRNNMIDKSKLKGYMTMKDMNIEKLAEKMEISSMTLRRKVNGMHDWRFNEVWLITQLLDCEITDLIKK